MMVESVNGKLVWLRYDTSSKTCPTDHGPRTLRPRVGDEAVRYLLHIHASDRRASASFS